MCCSTKYTLFCMIYNRDPVTPFELADNQRDGSPVQPHLSGESVTINDHVRNMKHIYQCILAKANSNIKKAQVTQQKYYNMCTFNNPFSLGNKHPKNMVSLP